MAVRPARHAKPAISGAHRPQAPRPKPVSQPAGGPKNSAPSSKPKGKARPGPGQTKIALPEPKPGELRPGEYLVRNIVTADPDTGVLAVSANVEEGQSIIFAHREATSAHDDLLRMLDEVSPERTGLPYRFGLYFNCLARGRSLYERTGVDLEVLQRRLPEVPLLGFFCNAEIAPLHGCNQLFTYTGVLLLVAE